VMRSICC